MRAILALMFVALGTGAAHAQWMAAAYIDNDIAGDVQSGRLGVGASADYFPHDWIGFELDAELHGHFFRDEDVAALQPTGVDLNTSAALASGNVVVPYCVGGVAGTWCPYATAGVGAIHAMFKGAGVTPGAATFERAQTNLTMNVGVGLTHVLTRWVGFRVDARYFHAFVDESSTGGGYFTDYGYYRISVGVTLGSVTP